MNKILQVLIDFLQRLVKSPEGTKATKKLSTTKKGVIVGSVAAIIGGMVANFEGLRNYPYRDIAGVMTVCYGHTGDVKERKYSNKECKTLLDRDIQKWADKVESCQPNLPLKVKAAFTSASFNLGSRIICNTKTSTAARLLREGKYKEACQQLPRWNKARVNGTLKPIKGLTIRRNKEMVLCLEDL